jgi:hypothetical protein
LLRLLLRLLMLLWQRQLLRHRLLLLMYANSS